MSGVLAVGGSGCCVLLHPTNSTAAIVVISMCFISLQLSILHGSLGSVFAEEVGDLGVFKFDGYI